jgi:hypothetical protein
MVKRFTIRTTSKKSGVRPVTYNTAKMEFFLKGLEFDRIFISSDQRTLQENVEYSRQIFKTLLFTPGWREWRNSGGLSLFSKILKKAGLTKQSLLDIFQSNNSESTPALSRPSILESATPAAAGEFNGYNAEDYTTPVRGKSRKRLSYSSAEDEASPTKRAKPSSPIPMVTSSPHPPPHTDEWVYSSEDNWWRNQAHSPASSPDYRPASPEVEPDTEVARRQMKKEADEIIQAAKRDEASKILGDLVISRRFLTSALCRINNIHNFDLRVKLDNLLSNLQGVLNEASVRAMPVEEITLD